MLLSVGERGWRCIFSVIFLLIGCRVDFTGGVVVLGSVGGGLEGSVVLHVILFDQLKFN